MRRASGQTRSAAHAPKRRAFIAGIGALAGVFALPRHARASSASKGKRVLILGGGFAGAKVAALLAERLPQADIALVERGECFIAGPLVLPYLFGERPLASICYGYQGLAARGVRLVHGEVRGVDVVRREVATTAGRLRYDILVVATGTRYDPGKDVGNESASPFDRDNLETVKRRLRAFVGGQAVIAVSTASTMCPPAPYEYALLLAEHMRRNRIDGRITFMESGPAPRPAPLAAHFERELARYRGLIEYLPSSGDPVRADAAKRIVYTSDGEEAPYDLLSVFPNGAVAQWVKELDSSSPGDLYVSVDPMTLRSTRHHELYALGDVARVPYGKSAFAADVCAARCAQSIANDLGEGPPPSERSVDVACFPYVQADAAMVMRVRYDLSDDAQIRSQARVEAPAAAGALARHEWESRTLLDVYRQPAGAANTN